MIGLYILIFLLLTALSIFLVALAACVLESAMECTNKIKKIFRLIITSISIIAAYFVFMDLYHMIELFIYLKDRW